MRVLNYEGSLQLVNCENELIEISRQALAILLSPETEQSENKRNTDKTEPLFKKGQLMALTFNNEGYILDIHKTTQAAKCS